MQDLSINRMNLQVQGQKGVYEVLRGYKISNPQTLTKPSSPTWRLVGSYKWGLRVEGFYKYRVYNYTYTPC